VVSDEKALPASDALDQVRGQPLMEGQALVARVSTPAPYRANEDGDVSVAVIDYGLKRSILKRLRAAGASVTGYPHLCDPDDLASSDGVLLSNGLGDPAPLAEETRVVRETLGRVPMLGIRLRQPLMGVAPRAEED